MDENIEQLVQQYSADFDKLCQDRHLAGQAEYGVFTFLGNDVVRMMAEELADTSNYCRMQFIKIMMLNEILASKLQAEDAIDPEGNVSFEGFRGVGEVGWKK